MSNFNILSLRVKRSNLIIGFIFFVVLISGIVFVEQANAVVPQTVNFSGRLTDNAGKAVTSTVSITFRIYDQVTGGTALWTEPQNNILVANGIFSVLLGSVNQTLANLPFDREYWVSMEVNNNGEMQPRQKLVSSFYALRALTAENVSVSSVPMVYTSHAEIDFDNPEKCYIHLDKAPTSIYLYLYGEKLNTMFYTEMGSHSHGTGGGGTISTDPVDINHTHNIEIVNHTHTAYVPMSAYYYSGRAAAVGTGSVPDWTLSAPTSLVSVWNWNVSYLMNWNTSHSHTIALSRIGFDPFGNRNPLKKAKELDKTYPKIKIYIDGADKTGDIGNPNNKPGYNDGVDKYWYSTSDFSTGKLDITNVAGVNWNIGEHTIEFKEQNPDGGGKVRYNIYIKY